MYGDLTFLSVFVLFIFALCFSCTSFNMLLKFSYSINRTLNNTDRCEPVKFQPLSTFRGHLDYYMTIAGAVLIVFILCWRLTILNIFNISTQGLFSPSTVINKLAFLLHVSFSSDLWAVYLSFLLLNSLLQHQGFSSQTYHSSGLLLESEAHSSFIYLDNTEQANSLEMMLNVFMM